MALQRIALGSKFAYLCVVPVLKSLPKKKSSSRKGKEDHVSEAELLKGATLRLMRAVKEKAVRDGKPLNRKQLLKQGYDEGFLDRLEKA